MAILIQTIEMVSNYVPYERPPQPYALWTAIPRGLQTFLIPFQALDDKPSPDDMLLRFTGTLPPNFGYVMNDAGVSITNPRAFDWTDNINLNLQNFYRGSDVADAIGANYVQDFTVWPLDLQTRTMVVKNPWPTSPMFGVPGTSGILLDWSTWNTISTTTIGGTVSGWISFWQFDLEQIRKYPINSPQPTHAR